MDFSSTMLANVGLDHEEYLLLPARDRMKLERRYTISDGLGSGRVDWAAAAGEASSLIAAWKMKHGSMTTRLARR